MAQQTLQQQMQQNQLEQNLNMLSFAAAAASQHHQPSSTSMVNSNVNHFLAQSLNKSLKIASATSSLSSSINRPSFQNNSVAPGLSSSSISSLKQQHLNDSGLSSLNSSSKSTIRPRAFSLVAGGGYQSNSLVSTPFGSTNSVFTATGASTTPVSANKTFFESNDEKLATTGNIFQRRDDWSILTRLPV